MIGGFPNRPLSAAETLTQSHEQDDLLVISATPNGLASLCHLRMNFLSLLNGITFCRGSRSLRR